MNVSARNGLAGTTFGVIAGASALGCGGQTPVGEQLPPVTGCSNPDSVFFDENGEETTNINDAVTGISACPSELQEDLVENAATATVHAERLGRVSVANTHRCFFGTVPGEELNYAFCE